MKSSLFQWLTSGRWKTGVVCIAAAGAAAGCVHKTRVAQTAVLVPALLATGGAAVQAKAQFRPPSVPLVANDPYLSIWSAADHLNDTGTSHWTHRPMSLESLIRIDGKPYRLMGGQPTEVPAFPQTGVQVTPTRSIYDFEDTAVHVTLTFMTPALPHDLEVLSRPVTYLTWSAKSVDGRPHKIAIYDSTSSELAVNTPDQAVTWARETMGPLTALRTGAEAQTLLKPAGDDTRIDWGYAYAVAPAGQTKSAIGDNAALLDGFATDGTLPAADDIRQPRPVSDHQPVLAFTFDLGTVGAAPVSRHLIVGYDELYNIKLAGKALRPYWRRNGITPQTMFQNAERDYPSLVLRCTEFDRLLTADATRAGGSRYAQIVALAYRQSLAANGLAADANNQPLLFTKENNSNGDIATVDVMFPQDPMLLLLSPTLAKASVVPILAYASSPVWKFPNSPHDMGTFPIASASGDPGEAMVVEESGNMLILCDAITQADGNPNFVSAYWPTLTKWADFLAQYGLDPGDQLCTDDFMGHLAHNANLSVKAIIALAAYGDMCKARSDVAGYKKYSELAKTDAAHWMQVADGGKASLLAFDRPGTWSQKYNLVWDQILGLNVFPPSIAAREVAYYKTVLQPYGVPLDSRTHQTKVDWTVWSATLAASPDDFQTLISPAYDYLNQTSRRDPLADGYTSDDLHSNFFSARPVVGGVFIKLLNDHALWMKWSHGDKVVAANWALLPKAPRATYLLATAQNSPVSYRYVTASAKPSGDWTKSGFDDGGWKTGNAPFANNPPGGIPTGTNWTDSDIWMRRTVTLPPGDYKNLAFMVYHDEDVEIYVNGVPAAADSGYNSAYDPLDITPAAVALLKPGATVTLAVHVHQTVGGQGIDLGLASLTPQ